MSLQRKPFGFFDTPVLKYVGSKHRIADWIVAQMPPHKTYVEPFCGGAAVFFRKPESNIEVLNDLAGDVVNFFQQLRDNSDALIRAIALTPYARDEYALSLQPCGDCSELERARRFYVASFQSFGATYARKSGWRKRVTPANGDLTNEFSRLDGLEQAVAALKHAYIENRPAIDVIQQYDAPDTLFYIDPPYVLSSRGDMGRKRYAHEMTDDQHRHLAEVVHHARGMVLLSGYKSDLYSELYRDWTLVTKTTTTNGNGVATEYLWLNQQATNLNNLPLFG